MIYRRNSRNKGWTFGGMFLRSAVKFSANQSEPLRGELSHPYIGNVRDGSSDCGGALIAETQLTAGKDRQQFEASGVARQPFAPSLGTALAPSPLASSLPRRGASDAADHLQAGNDEASCVTSSGQPPGQLPACSISGAADKPASSPMDETPTGRLAYESPFGEHARSAVPDSDL